MKELIQDFPIPIRLPYRYFNIHAYPLHVHCYPLLFVCFYYAQMLQVCDSQSR
jgi:hypothetical protein